MCLHIARRCINDRCEAACKFITSRSSTVPLHTSTCMPWKYSEVRCMDMRHTTGHKSHPETLIIKSLPWNRNVLWFFRHFWCFHSKHTKQLTEGDEPYTLPNTQSQRLWHKPLVQRSGTLLTPDCGQGWEHTCVAFLVWQLALKPAGSKTVPVNRSFQLQAAHKTPQTFLLQRSSLLGLWDAAATSEPGSSGVLAVVLHGPEAQ